MYNQSYRRTLKLVQAIREPLAKGLECNTLMSSEEQKTGNVERICNQALDEWNHVNVTGMIPVKRRTCVPVSEASPEKCVRFVYQRQNTQILACGTKKIKMQDGDFIEVRKVKRTRTIRAIVDA